MPTDREECTKLVEEQLDTISKYVWAQKTPLWGDSEGRIVSAVVLDEMLNDVRTCLPDDIRLANSILREEEHIKERAHDEADRMVDDAAREADKIVSDANQEAQKAIDDANRYRNDVTVEADEYDTNTREAADKYADGRRAAGDEYFESRTGDADGYYERKIAMAEEDAAEIIAEAEAEAERLISESEIMRQANERADQRRREAVLWCNRLHGNARKMADDIMEELMVALEDYLNLIGEEREKLRIHGEGGDQGAAAQQNTAPRENNIQQEQQQEYALGEDEVEYGGENDDFRSPLSKLGGLFRNRRQSYSNDSED